MKPLLWLALSLGVATLTTNTAHSQAVVQEDFNYGGSAGSLSGQNGGTGFSTAWNGGSYVPTSLSFSNLDNAGGAYQTDSGGGQRVFTSAFATSGPIYGSFLFRSTQTGATVQQLGLGNSGATNNQNSALRFSPSSDGAVTGGTRKGTVVVQGGTEGVLTSSGYTSGTTYIVSVPL